MMRSGHHLLFELPVARWWCWDLQCPAATSWKVVPVQWEALGFRRYCGRKRRDDTDQLNVTHFVKMKPLGRRPPVDGKWLWNPPGSTSFLSTVLHHSAAGSSSCKQLEQRRPAAVPMKHQAANTNTPSTRNSSAARSQYQTVFDLPLVRNISLKHLYQC